MNDLPLQVGLVNCVEIDDAQRSDSSSSEIEQRWAAEPSGADHQHPGILQPLLAVHPNIGNDQVTAVTAYLVDGQLIGGRYQRRQGHGSPPAQGRGTVPRQACSILIVTRVRGRLFRMMG